jgi:hypothetical protein
MMKVVPKLPILKKIFNPKKHSFLKIGNIFIADSFSFNKLLSSVMFMNKLNTCLVYANPRSNVDLKIIREMKKGILSSAASNAMFFYKSKNISLDELKGPQFLSIADSI